MGCQISRNERNAESPGECGDYFPFLDLPNELIAHTFSFLPIEDRMRARVNKRLDAIELKSKYYVERLSIEEVPLDASNSGRSPYVTTNGHSIVFSEEKSYSSDCIRRLTRNASIGLLSVDLSGWDTFHRDVYNLIKDFDVETVHLDAKNSKTEMDAMDGSFFLGLAKSCKFLDFKNRFGTMEASDLHELYKIMHDESGKLRSLSLEFGKKRCVAFLALIGITYRDGRFFSKRNLEAFLSPFRGFLFRERIHVFDGNLEIVLSNDIFNRNKRGKLTLILHESLVSLVEAKSRPDYERIL